MSIAQRWNYMIRSLYRSNISLFFLTLTLFGACVPLYQRLQSSHDVSSPVLLEYALNGAQTITMEFSEPVIPGDVQEYEISGGHVVSIDAAETVVKFSFSGCNEPGTRYALSGRVEDLKGNELWFSLPFYGYNASPPELVINEIIVENSSSRYEKMELYVLRGGNLGGITIYNGSPGEHRSRMIFLPQDVETDEYMVIHFRSDEAIDNLITEIDEYGESETAMLNTATSAQATTSVRDFWVRGYQGLSDSNGAVCIALNPDIRSPILDAFLWSNRNFDPDAVHGSFGTAFTYNVMRDLQSSGAWEIGHEVIRPEDCYRSEDSTSTRSINRASPHRDSNSVFDWHICPTGESSFGWENSTEEYQ